MPVDRHGLLIAAIWRHCDDGPERCPAVVADHRNVIGGVAERDVGAVGSIMAAHALKVRQALMARRRTDAVPLAPSA